MLPHLVSSDPLWLSVGFPFLLESVRRDRWNQAFQTPGPRCVKQRRNRVCLMWPAWSLAGVPDSLDHGAHNEQPKQWSRHRRLPMLLVERHLVRKDHPQYASIDAAAFASKNLYNQANYQIRQAFIHED